MNTGSGLAALMLLLETHLSWEGAIFQRPPVAGTVLGCPLFTQNHAVRLIRIPEAVAGTSSCQDMRNASTPPDRLSNRGVSRRAEPPDDSGSLLSHILPYQPGVPADQAGRGGRHPDARRQRTRPPGRGA